VGGRDLPKQFTFTTFCDWIRHELETELGRRWKIEMKGVGAPDTYARAAGRSARGLVPAPFKLQHLSETTADAESVAAYYNRIWKCLN